MLAAVAVSFAFVLAPSAPRNAVSRASVSMDAKRQQLEDKRRQSALITGTNWPPRTPPEPGKGYFFFQGPTPKTAYQKDLPSFFSTENFADLEIKPVQIVVTLTGFASLALILLGLNSGTPDMAAAPAKPAV